MSDDKEKVKKVDNVVAAESANAGTTKPVSRRGVGNQTRGTTRLKFDNRDAQPNGLFLGHLNSVEVREITIGEDTTGMPSFNGLSIPKIVFTFSSNEADASKRRYVILQFNAIESNADTIPGGKKEWTINQVFDYFKHFLNVYVLKGREMTPEEEAALSLSYEDFDEEGQYVPVDSETVIAGWRSLFENYATMLNKGRDSEPVYKTKEGKPIAIWMKLLRYVKSRKKDWQAVNNGDLSFPTFVGEGVIEIFKQNAAPVLKVDIIREDIKPRQIDTPKAPNLGAPAMGSAPMFGGGIPMGDPMMDANFDNNLRAQAADDLPF